MVVPHLSPHFARYLVNIPSICRRLCISPSFVQVSLQQKGVLNNNCAFYMQYKYFNKGIFYLLYKIDKLTDYCNTKHKVKLINWQIIAIPNIRLNMRKIKVKYLFKLCYISIVVTLMFHMLFTTTLQSASCNDILLYHRGFT